jgi:hypothetical protein
MEEVANDKGSEEQQAPKNFKESLFEKFPKWRGNITFKCVFE